MTITAGHSQTSQIKTLIDGWKNLLFRNSAAENIARERKKICLICPHSALSTCGLCGCPLPAKQRALDAICPDGRW